jgi:hypothetical protein
LKHQIQSLTLIFIKVDDRDFSNFEKFHQSLIDGFTRLEKFEYPFNTIHQIDDLHFPNIEQLLLIQSTIYNLPKPFPFDNTSNRTMFIFHFSSDLTPQELMNCKILHIDSTGGQPPSQTSNDNLRRYLCNLS